MPRRAPVDGPSDAPVHASRRAQPPRVVLDGMPAHVQQPRDLPHACATDPNHAADQTPLEVGPLGPRVGKQARPLRRSADRRARRERNSCPSHAAALPPHHKTPAEPSSVGVLALATSTPHRLSMGGSQTRPCTDRPRFGPSHRRSSRRIARHERSPQPASGWGGRSALHKHVIHVQSASRLQGCCWAEGWRGPVRGERFRAKRCCTRELVTTRRATAHLIIGPGTDRGAAASLEL
jgi:hypothetical protein